VLCCRLRHRSAGQTAKHVIATAVGRQPHMKYRVFVLGNVPVFNQSGCHPHCGSGTASRTGHWQSVFHPAPDDAVTLLLVLLLLLMLLLLFQVA
jgi:hypothetical protein